MHRTSQYPGVARIKELEDRHDLRQVMAISAYRQQASKAGTLKAIYRQSPAQYVMRFQDFQKPKERNQILVQLGLEPIHLPCDRRPKRRKSCTKH